MATLIQPSFSKGEINPDLHGRVDTAAYKVGLATARNTIVKVAGGIANRPGTEFIGFAIDMTKPSRLRRFRFNAGDSYILEFAEKKMRVIRNDAYVRENGIAITSITQGYPAVLSTATPHGYAAGDDIEPTDVNGMTRVNNRRFRVMAPVTSTSFALQDIITGLPVDSTGYPAYTYGGASRRVYTLTTPYFQADLKLLKFVQSADVLTITHTLYPEMRLNRLGDANWTLTAATFNPSINPPTGVTVTPVGPAGTSFVTATYVVTAIDATTGEESYASLPGTTLAGNPTADNQITWTGIPNTSLYSVYKAVNGVYGLVGTTPGLTFEEKNLIPILSTTPPVPPNPDPFSGPGYYPGVSTYYQQRQVRGGSLNKPDTLYYSKPGSYYNISKSVPSNPDDAITATLTSREVNAIQFLVPLKADLICFTTGNEWRINSANGGFSATTAQQLPQSSWGCSYLEPIVIGLTALFAPENQISIRSAEYSFSSDSYGGADLSLLAGHMLAPGKELVDWAFARTPDPIIFGTRADGQAVALTYQEDQQVTAWCRWDTDGAYETVEVIRPNFDTSDDVPYFCIRRLVNGNIVRYIERLHSRRFDDVRDCFFVDSGLSYDNPITVIGANMVASGLVQLAAPGHGLQNNQTVDVYDIVWQPVFDENDNPIYPDVLNRRRYVVANVTPDTIDLAGATELPATYAYGGTLRVAVNGVTALDHLEGKTVVALADGNVVTNLVVTGGAVTFPFLASRIHVGLKFISDVGSLDFEAPQGTIQGKFKRLPSITVRFDKSRGALVGPDPLNMVEFKERAFEDIGDPTTLITGDEVVTTPATWNDAGRVFCRQRYPLPMHILDMIPDFDISV